MIDFSCPTCKKAFSAPEEMAGWRGNCSCGESLEVPPARSSVAGADDEAIGEQTSAEPIEVSLNVDTEPWRVEYMLGQTKPRSDHLLTCGTMVMIATGAVLGSVIGAALDHWPAGALAGAILFVCLFFLLRVFGVGRHRA